MNKKDGGYHALFIVSIIVFYLYVFRKILFLGIVQAGDLLVPINSFQQLNAYLFNSFNYQVGVYSGYNLGIIFYGLLATLFHNPSFSQKMIYYLSMPLSAVFAYFYFNKMRFPYIMSMLLGVFFSFSPWLIGEFMTGGLDLYTFTFFLPLFTYFLWEASEKKLGWIDCLTISLILSIANSFTLQSLLVYSVIGVPFLLRGLLKMSKKTMLYNYLLLAIAAIISVLSNLYSLNPYLSAYSGAMISSKSFFSSFTSSTAKNLTIYLYFLNISTVLIALFSLFTKKIKDTIFQMCLAIFSMTFFYFYSNINNKFVQEIITILLPPFLNFDMYLFVSWTLCFLSVIYFIKDFILDKEIIVAKFEKKQKIRKAVKHSWFLAPIFLILIITSVFASIQPVQDRDYGQYFFLGDFNFNHEIVPKQYFELQDFLLQHNISFGFSYHTIIVPETPGYIIPFYIGSTMIPGFLGLFPPKIFEPLIQQLQQNNEINTLTIMSILGIKYIAVMPNVKTNWNGWNGTPNIGMWGDEDFFNGYWKYYYDIFANWTLLKMVYSKDNLTVFENTLIKSPILQVNDNAYLENLIEGNFTGNYLIKPFGSNLAKIEKTDNGNGWYISSYGQASYESLNTTTFKIFFGTDGIELYQPDVNLYPNTYYLVSFDFVQLTHNTIYASSFGYWNSFMGLYWNKGTGSNISGACVDTLPPGNFSGHVVYLCKTPSYPSNITAEFALFAEPPLQQGAVNYVSFSNIVLVAVNATPKLYTFNQPNFSSSGVTIHVFNIKHINKQSLLLFDVTYSPLWRARTQNGLTIYPTKTPFDTLAFNITNFNGQTLVVYFQGQTIYYLTLIISFLTYAALIAMLILVTVRRFPHVNRR